MKFVPREYQAPISNSIYSNQATFVIATMGAGKTAATLQAITDKLDSCEVNNILLIAPLTVAKDTWPREIAKWDNFKHINYGVAIGTPDKRKAVIESCKELTLINRENVPWLVKEYGKKWPFDMVIIDESSSFKSSSSQRFKALKKIRPKVDHWALLTGTPAPNNPLELWSQVFLLDGGHRLGKSFTAFKNRFFESDYMGYKFEPRAGAEKHIQDLIADLCVVVESYGGLPDRVDLIEPVQLTAKVQKQYSTMSKELLLEFADSDVTAVNAAVLAGKLQQIANGTIYDENRDIVELHSAKLDALDSIVEQCEGESILLAYNYKHDLERIKERYPDAVSVKDEGAIARWNNGEIKMLLAHPACLHPETLVLTEHRGWVPIVSVAADEKVHDGVEFVNHDGCRYSGYSHVKDLFGFKMTNNHKLLIGSEWTEAKDVDDCERVRRKARYTHTGNDCSTGEMLRLRYNEKDTQTKRDQAQPSRANMQDVHNNKKSRNVENEILRNLARYKVSVCRHVGQKLRFTRYIGLREMAQRIPRILQGYVSRLCGRVTNRPDRHGERLFKGELPMGYPNGTTIEQTEQSKSNVPRRGVTFSGILPSDRSESREDCSEVKQGDEWGRRVPRRDEIYLQTEQEKAHVYDLVNCGKRNRFLIKNKQGEVFISHNSAGHGLNLQDGGNRIVWYSPTWSTELKLQFDARLYRQGQSKPVFIHTLAADGTIDLDIIDAVKHKKSVQDLIIEGVKNA